jgi:hypothetical protein
MIKYLAHLESGYLYSLRPGLPKYWHRPAWYELLVQEIAEQRDTLPVWLWLNAALLAALLLFLRANGYRLTRRSA